MNYSFAAPQSVEETSWLVPVCTDSCSHFFACRVICTEVRRSQSSLHWKLSVVAD